MTSAFRLIDDNSQFIVVDKSHNVNFHSEDNEPGIVELVKSSLDYPMLYPVHRLDKMTSGLLILAKTSEVAARFGELFSQRKIEKYYLAVSDKKPKKKQGLIKGDMSKGRNGSYLLLKTNENPAVTQFFSYSLADGLRIYLLKPHSGKTHQLRVAMKSNSTPIKGDRRYYPNNDTPVGLLHAWCLRFNLKGQDYRYQVAPDWDVLDAINGVSEWCNQHSKPWDLNWPKLPRL